MICHIESNYNSKFTFLWHCLFLIKLFQAYLAYLRSPGRDIDYFPLFFRSCCHKLLSHYHKSISCCHKILSCYNKLLSCYHNILSSSHNLVSGSLKLVSCYHMLISSHHNVLSCYNNIPSCCLKYHLTVYSHRCDMQPATHTTTQYIYI